MFKRINLYLILFFVITGFVIFAGCSEDDTEAPESDTTPPTVLATEPADSAADVSRSGPFWVLFSETMNEGSVEDSLSFHPGGVISIEYNTYWNGDTIFISPDNLLNVGDYIITASGSSEDIAGNQLGDDYIINFTTTSDEDLISPTVISTIPADGAADVTPVITIEITFSEPIQIPSWDWDTQAFFNIEPYPEDGEISVEGPTLLLENLIFPQDSTVDVTLNSGSGNVTDLAGNPMEENYSFSFSTLTDETRPTLVSATPPNEATGVSTGLSQMIFNFSEPMNTEFDMPPENVDARIENAIPDDPTWNADITSLTVPVTSSLIAPGCTYWVRFAATDMAGNPIDPDPTPYEFTTSGTVSYFPVADDNTWYFNESGTTNTEKSFISNYNAADGTFDITFQDDNGGTLETYDVWHMKKTSTEIQHLGRDEYSGGTLSETWTWDTPLTFFKLPVTDHLGEQWNISTNFEMQGVNANLSGTVTMGAGLTDIIVTGDQLEGTFRLCAKHTLSITISIGAETMEINEQNWLAPGVGWIKEIADESGSAEIDTLVVEGWVF